MVSPPGGPDLHGSCACSHKEPPKLTLHTRSEKNTVLARLPPYHVPILFSALMEFFPADQAQKIAGRRPKVDNSATVSGQWQNRGEIILIKMVSVMEVHRRAGSKQPLPKRASL